MIIFIRNHSSNVKLFIAHAFNVISVCMKCDICGFDRSIQPTQCECANDVLSLHSCFLLTFITFLFQQMCKIYTHCKKNLRSSGTLWI